MQSPSHRHAAAFATMVFVGAILLLPVCARSDDSTLETTRTVSLDGVDYEIRAWTERPTAEETARADSRVPRSDTALVVRATVTATSRIAPVGFAPHPFTLHEVLHISDDSSYHSGQIGGGALDAHADHCVRPDASQVFERALRGASYDYVPGGFRYEVELGVVVADGCRPERTRKRLAVVVLDRRTASRAQVRIELPEPYP